MTARHVVGLVPVVILALAGLTACSAGSDAAPTTDDILDRPIVQYLGPVFSRIDDTEEQQIADNTKIEEAISACMAAEGFDYIPVPWTPNGGMPTDFRPDDRDWVSRYGYGSIDFPGYAEIMADNDDGDVNTPYYDSLSTAEQAVYSATLWGPPDQVINPNGGPTWDQLGCHGTAYREVYGDDPMQDAENKPVVDALNAFLVNETDGPEFDGLNAEWAECMAAKGHPGFTRQEDAAASIEDEAIELRSSRTDTLMPDDPDAHALQLEEIALALDDLDCREQTDYRQRSLEIQYDLERQYIADHRAELDALIAQVQQTPAG